MNFSISYDCLYQPSKVTKKVIESLKKWEIYRKTRTCIEACRKAVTMKL